MEGKEPPKKGMPKKEKPKKETQTNEAQKNEPPKKEKQTKEAQKNEPPKKETQTKEAQKNEPPKKEKQTKEAQKNEPPKKEIPPKLKGIDVEKRDSSGNAPLHLAAQTGNAESVRNLLFYSIGMNVNVRNHMGETPLHLAAEGGHMEVVILLLASGADPSVLDNSGTTASHLAASQGHIEIMEIMSKREAQMTNNRERVYYDPTPSPHAFGMNLVRKPIKSKDSANKEATKDASDEPIAGCSGIKKEENATPAQPQAGHKKIKRGGRKHKKRQVEEERPVQPVRPDKITDLYLRVMTQYPDDVENKLRDYFMDGRFDEINCSVIDTNRTDKAGLTILHHAVRCCRYMAVERLVVKCKANVNAETFRGVTPMFFAATTGYMDVIRILHENGANINHTLKCGMTPLHYAVVHKNMNSVRTLCYLGANLDSPDHHGNTPLHYAAMTPGNVRVVEALIDRGADPHYLNSDGLRPLEIAIRANDREIIRYLKGVTEEVRGTEVTRDFKRC